MSALRGSNFSVFRDRIRAYEGRMISLHVGDSWMEPCPSARMENLRVDEFPGMHRYSPPHGRPELLQAIAERRGVERGRILVSAGATGCLNSLAMATLEPGDEVLILAPYWPLIRGVVQVARGRPVEVPFFVDPAGGVATVDDLEPGAITRLLSKYLGERTVALYINTPHNPTGRVLSRDQVQEMAEFCKRHNLWIWSDEIYENYSYSRPHVSVGEMAPERTFCTYSFTKAYGMTGNRCGYIIGPNRELMFELRKVSTHSVYCSPSASQLAAWRVLSDGADWLVEAARAYQGAGEAAADVLGVPRPEGGTFLFLDVRSVLDGRGLIGWLGDCVNKGVLLAPGSSCGADYGGFVRLCFTSETPELTAEGVGRLRSLLGHGA